MPSLNRLLSQQKAVKVFLFMTVWILMLIAGVYKFWRPRQHVPQTTGPVISGDSGAHRSGLDYDVKTRRIYRMCNFPHEINHGEEGELDSPEWMLRGVMVFIRHGDRGPLQHIRNVGAIDCSTPQSELLKTYQTYLQNMTVTGRTPWTGPGPFHAFPLLPGLPHRLCQLGQLTMQGVLQQLYLGRTLRESYTKAWPKLAKLSASEVAVYSTRYRRTFQSALAFLYGLLNSDMSLKDAIAKETAMAKLVVHESPSLSFCFNDCGCPITDKYSRALKQDVKLELKEHPAVRTLSETTAWSIFDDVVDKTVRQDPQAIRDALLTFICHRSPLPCESPIKCVKRQNVVGIFAYTDWALHRKWQNVTWKRYCLLRSYGLIKHMVSKMLNMLSHTGPYLLLYSGHDHTLEQLATALGLYNEPPMFQYAGRIVFEVYHHQPQQRQRPAETLGTSGAGTSSGARGLHFRILRNGRDVTRQASFCRDFVTIDGDIHLCKIEDIVRFIHDDYFAQFNESNYKDACYYKPQQQN